MNKHYLEQDMPYVEHELEKMRKFSQMVLNESSQGNFDNKDMLISQLESSFHLLKQMNDKKREHEIKVREVYF